MKSLLFPGDGFGSGSSSVLLAILIVLWFPDPRIAKLCSALSNSETVVACCFERVLFSSNTIQEALRRLVLRVGVALCIRMKRERDVSFVILVLGHACEVEALLYQGFPLTYQVSCNLKVIEGDLFVFLNTPAFQERHAQFV